MIKENDWVAFVSPDDGKTYTGRVEKIRRATSIATIVYQHDYGNAERYEQREYLHVLRLTPAAAPAEAVTGE